MIAAAKLSDAETKETEWLLYPYIPKTGITLFNGGTCVGKSILLWNLMARLSRNKLPDGFAKIEKPCAFPQHIIYQDLVDFNYSITAMNLEKDDADMSKFSFINMMEVNKADGKDKYDRKLPTIEEFGAAVKSLRADVLVIDPVTFLFKEGSGDYYDKDKDGYEDYEEDVDKHNERIVREEEEYTYNANIIKGLKELTLDYKCTVILADYWLYDIDLYKVGKGADLITKAASSILQIRRPGFENVTKIRQMKNKKGPIGKTITVTSDGDKLWWE